MFALFPEFGARTRPQDLPPFLISSQPGQPGSYEEALKYLL